MEKSGFDLGVFIKYFCRVFKLEFLGMGFWQGQFEKFFQAILMQAKGEDKGRFQRYGQGCDWFFLAQSFFLEQLVREGCSNFGKFVVIICYLCLWEGCFRVVLGDFRIFYRSFLNFIYLWGLGKVIGLFSQRVGLIVIICRNIGLKFLFLLCFFRCFGVKDENGDKDGVGRGFYLVRVVYEVWVFFFQSLLLSFFRFIVYYFLFFCYGFLFFLFVSYF